MHLLLVCSVLVAYVSRVDLSVCCCFYRTYTVATRSDHIFIQNCRCLVHISSVAAMYETQIANCTVAQAYTTSWNQRTSIYDTKKTNEISNKNCFICTSYSHFVAIVIQYQAPYDTIRDVVLTCAQKLTYVSLIYWTEPKNKKWKKRITKK